MIVCETPIVTEPFRFLFDHLDCDCIADTEDENKNGMVRILAYSEKKEDNCNLYTYFLNNGFSGTGRFVILQGIASEEVDCID